MSKGVVDIQIIEPRGVNVRKSPSIKGTVVEVYPYGTKFKADVEKHIDGDVKWALSNIASADGWDWVQTTAGNWVALHSTSQRVVLCKILWESVEEIEFIPSDDEVYFFMAKREALSDAVLRRVDIDGIPMSQLVKPEDIILLQWDNRYMSLLEGLANG